MTMRFMVMIKATTSTEAGVLPKTEDFAAMSAYQEEMVNAGILIAGNGLKPSSAGARVRFSGNERTVIDGPFAETKELVAGYSILEVASKEEVLEWVKRCPNTMPDEEWEIEIRPIYSDDDFGDAATPELREIDDRLRATAAEQHPNG
jgi:hypothetical protein